MTDSGAVAGQLIGGRYRLEQCLSQGSQGALWRGADRLAGEAPVAQRQRRALVDVAVFAAVWLRRSDRGPLESVVARVTTPRVRPDAAPTVQEG